MSISSRIHDTIEQWQAEWKERLRGWMASWFELGFTRLFDFFEPELRDEIKPQLQTLRDIPNLPPEYKNILDKAIGATSAIQFAAILPYLVGMLIGLGMGAASPMSRIGAYSVDKMIHSARLDPITAFRALKRGFITEEYFNKILNEQGWNEEDRKTLFDVTHFYPTPADLVHWQAREVFEPTMIAKYGLDAEVEEIDPKLFDKAGVSEAQMINYWRAHWVHPDWRQVADMYHRGLITFDDIERWYRVVEIPPYWRDKLTGITWDLPNRIETRMMARYGLVTKDWLVAHLERIGLHEDYRSIAADFMLAMGIRLDISTRYSKGWLSKEEVWNEIERTGLSPEIGERLYMWIVKNTQAERVTKERDLTKSELVKGVKKEVITRSEGIELLQGMGYDEDEASYIMDINVAAEAGSPETYMEFVELLEEYKRSQGLEYKLPPPELMEAGKALREVEASLKEAEAKGIKGEKLAPYQKAKDDAGYRYRQLLTQWREKP